MTWEYFSSYRGIPVYRRERAHDPYPHRGKFEYMASLNGIDLMTRSMEAIKTQIGRVRNGLSPSDCRICPYLVRATPVGMEYCEMACKETFEKNRGGPCPCFTR